ncbi:unnamed protein product [Effrenium voratum]|uniref:Uncharacterized protein n=1 Tax=Effrenium voratum TaxID=2562239 RepID=A0AA36NDV4_9DINO|nr:unnamed protein product [Effrenium voratum]CAJ1418132.1 unnamed protein product [Effrenium voratum]
MVAEDPELHFLAAKYFRLAMLQRQALTTPLPDEPTGEMLRLDTEPLLWLAAALERCPVPGGWRRWNDSGKEIYIDEFSSLPPRTVHPMLGYFLRLAAIVLAAPKTSCQWAKKECARFRKDLAAESRLVQQQYEHPQACGLPEWYHKQCGWFTETDPLQAHTYLLQVAKDLEGRLSNTHPPEDVCAYRRECRFYDIAKPKSMQLSPLFSSPESIRSINETELECQYEQNWNAVGPEISGLASTQATPQTWQSSSDSEFGGVTLLQRRVRLDLDTEELQQPQAEGPSCVQPDALAEPCASTPPWSSVLPPAPFIGTGFHELQAAPA